MNILFIQPARQVSNLGVDIDRLSHAAHYGTLRPSSLPHRLGEIGVVVNCMDTSKAARRILEVAASCGLPRLYLFDGIYDVANAYHNPKHKRYNISQMDPLLYTHIACVDRWSLEAFSALGVRTHAWLPAHAVPDENEGDDRQTQTADFLVATANAPVFDQQEQVRLKTLIDLVTDCLERIGARYRFRIGNRNLMTSLGVSSADNDTQEPFAKCIRRYRCLITTPSTIATTAMLAGLPTATLDYRDSPLTQQTGWRIHQSTDIERTLMAMLHPAGDRMAFQVREVAHLAKRTPVEDFILDAAKTAHRPDTPLARVPLYKRFRVSVHYPLRWAYVNWFKRFLKPGR